MVYSDQAFSEENADDRRDRHLKSRPRDRRISKTDRMFARGSRGKLRRVTCVQLAISEIRYKRRIRYSYPMEYWPPTTPMTTTVYTLVCRARLKKTPTGQREKEEHEGESIARVFLRSTIGRTNTSRYLQCTYCSPSLLLSDTFLPPAVSVCSVVCTFPPPGTLHRSSYLATHPRIFPPDPPVRYPGLSRNYRRFLPVVHGLLCCESIGRNPGTAARDRSELRATTRDRAAPLTMKNAY